ncbi:hypothetical protein PTKU15_53670 [Paraburkholderia terrae]|nr:hypothetical protein PTKU15_53670 [Paraburkholderia terrae]
MPAREDVLCHGEIRAEIDFLIQRLDTRGFGFERRGETHGFAREADFARVLLVYAREHIDERGFTRAVLAHQRMDFAGEKPEVDARQRLHAGKRLADADGFE